MAALVRLFSVIVVIGLLGSATLMRAQAIQATPEAVPSDQACKAVKPIGILDLFNLADDLDQASSNGENVSFSVWGPTLATGPEISTAERSEIGKTLDAFIACVNLRDPMRIVALLSQRFQALLVMDLLSGADKTSVIAKQIPVILDSPDRSAPLQAPTIERAWRENQSATNIWAIISLPIPGYTDDVRFFVAFAPGGDGWKIDEIAKYDA